MNKMLNEKVMKALEQFRNNNKTFQEFCIRPTAKGVYSLYDELDDFSISIENRKVSFTLTSGATKMVLLPNNAKIFPYVIKIPITIEERKGEIIEKFNYCEKEVQVYNAAKEDERIKGLFAECGEIGKLDNIKIYWMDYYKVNECVNSQILFDSYRNYIGDMSELDEDFFDGYYDQTSEFLMSTLLEELYPDNCDSILDFFDKFSINDLHSGNYHYDKYYNKIVLIDYSGF